MAKGKVGDRIRVVDAMTGDEYADGDVGTITRIEDGLSGVDVRLDSIGYHHEDDYHYLHACEYEIIGQEASREAHQEDGPIPWEVGQEVFCLLRGKGVVIVCEEKFRSMGCLPIGVKFPTGEFDYSKDGVPSIGRGCTIRTLFFSEPQVIAETMPPKKPFVPVLNRGDIVVMVHMSNLETVGVLVVKEEQEVWVVDATDTHYSKQAYLFYKLGDKVEFNV